MSEISNTVIERKGTTEIERLCNQERLESHVLFNDKTISFDGHISLYENGERTKKSFLDKIEIQVKTSTTLKGTTELKYTMEKDDLNNYKKASIGVLFLVILTSKTFDYNENPKVYYKKLFHDDIDIILREMGNNASKTIKMDLLNPDDKMGDFLQIIESMHEEQAKIRYNAFLPKIQLEDINKHDLEDMQFKLNCIFDFESGTLKVKNKDIGTAINEYGNIVKIIDETSSSTSCFMNVDIIQGDEVIYSNKEYCMSTDANDSDYIKLSDSLMLKNIFRSNADPQINFSFKDDKHSLLKDILYDLNFLLQIDKETVIYFAIKPIRRIISIEFQNLFKDIKELWDIKIIFENILNKCPDFGVNKDTLTFGSNDYYRMLEFMNEIATE